MREMPARYDTVCDMSARNIAISHWIFSPRCHLEVIRIRIFTCRIQSFLLASCLCG
jgi:hypothetical protein